jgi:hypothetical protein
MKEIFFHVGLGKVASTYLQYAFFPKLKGLRYIQRTNYQKSPDIIKKSSENRFLVSREFDQQLEEECRWFSTFFPEARIILIFRRHDSWIASQYRRFVKNGESLTFTEFIDIKKDTGLWKLSDLDFYKKIEIVKKYFPDHEPLILFYEDMKSDPFAFFKKIGAYTQTTFSDSAISLNKIHTSYSEKQLKVIRSISGYLFKQNPKFSKVRFFRWLQRRSRLLACYLILYPAALIPKGWVSKKPLIDPEELEKIRLYFLEDWNKVRDYASKQNY